MRLNGIKCTNYTAEERFSAVLHETDIEAIKSITPSRIMVQADDGSTIEEFTDYGRLFSVKHIISENIFEVEFSQVSETDKKLSEFAELGKNLGQKINDSNNVTSIVFTALAQNETLDDTTISEHADIFPKWDENWTGKKGTILRDGDMLYRSIHDVGIGQNVKPSDNPSMWTPIGDPREEFPDWSQPLGAHDTYGKGDKATHNNKKWISTVDGNCWEPGVYGWEEFKED